MPKTRQQRLAEERAGHPSSPPQFLEDKPRGSRRTRAKTPSATVAAGPVVPAAQLAVLGEPQALLCVWVDAGPEASGRPVDDPTHQMTIPSSFVPELVAFIENIRNQKKQNPEQPEPAKNQTTSNLPNGRKSAFRRNPLLATSAVFKSLPVEASLDTSTADGISSQAVPSLQADTRSFQQGTLTPETPRRSIWSIGNLFQSARSIKSRFGFSPLAPVLESPESSSQTSAMSTAQMPTEMTAPAQPKKKSSPPTSAKDTRARNRRHEDSVIKPVNPTTASKNQKDRASRAKEPSPVSGETEALDAEVEKSQAIDSQGEIGGPTAEPIIRWPSRSLDRMNLNKRKRWGEPVAMPSPEVRRCGFGEADIYGSSEDGETKQKPGKIRRTGESGGFTSQAGGHPNTSWAYQYQGGNVFAEYGAAQKAESAGQKPLSKTPTPITNSAGTFKVPSPGDSDWSDSGSEEEEEGNTAGMGDMTPSRANNGEFATAKPRPRYWPSTAAVNPEPTGRAKFTGYEDWCKTAPPSVTAALEKMEVDSNFAGHAFARGLEDSGAGRANRFTAYEKWSKTAPPAVTAVLETMEVDSNFAGQAFKSGLDNFINPK